MPNRPGPQTEPSEAPWPRPIQDCNPPSTDFDIFSKSEAALRNEMIPDRFDTFRHPAPNGINAVRNEIALVKGDMAKGAPHPDAYPDAPLHRPLSKNSAVSPGLSGCLVTPSPAPII